MLKKFVIISIITLFVMLVNGMEINAQGPTPTVEPPYGWGKETNNEWMQICDPDTLSPYESGFIPNDASRFVEDNDRDFYTLYSEIPTSYIEEGYGFDLWNAQYGSRSNCLWDAHVNIAAAPGSVDAETPGLSFINDVEYADITFQYAFLPYTGVPSVMWRDIDVKTTWDNGSTTVQHDYISTSHNCDRYSAVGGSCIGFLSINVEPQNGRHIDRIWIEFPRLDYSSIALIGDFLNGFPPPQLAVDKLLIRGFYPISPFTPTPTGTPAATGTPTATRTPSATTTPRNLWDTPTPTPTGVFTPTATPTGVPTKLFDWVFKVPTKIPPIRLPSWPTPPTVVLLPPTPSSLMSLPLIPTPAPISPTSTLVPLNLSIVITYPTFAAFVAPTETATPIPTVTGTPVVTNCYTSEFNLPTLPANWEIVQGEFVPNVGIRFTGSGSTRWLEINNTTDTYFSSIGFDGTPDGHPMIYSIAGDSGESGLPEFYENLTFDPPRNYVGYRIYLEIVYTGETLLTSAPYCTSGPPPTATPTATPTRDDIVADLNTINGTLQAEAAWMTTPTTFTIQTAPITYAEHLPRPMANVGYTFENMQGNIGFMYDPRAWASLFGYIIGLPIAMVKFLYTMAGMMGPVGMFVTWLLILLPFTLWIKLALFIKNLVITIINLIIKLIQFIGDLWDLIPFG